MTQYSVTGAELDPIDGRPVFADGMSRRRWLDENREERMGVFLEQLTAPEGFMVGEQGPEVVMVEEAASEE